MNRVRELDLEHSALINELRKLVKMGRTDYENDTELYNLCSKVDDICGKLSQLGETGYKGGFEYIDQSRNKDNRSNKMAKDFEYAFNKFGAGPLNSWLDSYADTTLGDGQDHDAYQEFRSLRDDVPEKWAFVKNHEGLSDEEMFDNFINYGYGGEEPMLQVKDVDDHYNGSFVDAGVLSGMLTDTPEIHKATVNWMKGLTGSDLDELNKITSSQTFKDMYGDPDWEGTDQDDYSTGFAAAQNSDDPTAPAGKSNSFYDGWNDGLFEKSNTKVGSIAKSITANDLGRSL